MQGTMWHVWCRGAGCEGEEGASSVPQQMIAAGHPRTPAQARAAVCESCSGMYTVTLITREPESA